MIKRQNVNTRRSERIQQEAKKKEIQQALYSEVKAKKVQQIPVYDGKERKKNKLEPTADRTNNIK